MKIFLILENLQLDKKFIEISKKHKDREIEIEILKNKLAALTSNINVNNNAMNPPLQYDPRQVTFSANDDEIVNNSPLQNKHQKFVSDVNKKNVDDLEALYFNDKIEMKDTSRSPKLYHIPRLDFGLLNVRSPSLKNNKTINNAKNNLFKKFQV